MGNETAETVEIIRLWSHRVTRKLLADSHRRHRPKLLAAVQERVVYNEAHPEPCFTSAEMGERLAQLKRKIAARRAHA